MYMSDSCVDLICSVHADCYFPKTTNVFEYHRGLSHFSLFDYSQFFVSTVFTIDFHILATYDSLVLIVFFS